MLKKTNSLLKTGVILVLITLFFSACISQKEIKYLQPSADNTPNKTEFTQAEIEAYRFNYGNNVYINIRSLDEKSNEMFNPSSVKKMMNG